MKKKLIFSILLLMGIMYLSCSCKSGMPSAKLPATADSTVIFVDKEIDEYVIVLPQNPNINEKNIAFFLKSHLYNSFGYDLDIVSDEKKYDCEILVGNTARSNSKCESGYFYVSSQNGILELAATDIRGYEGLFDYIKNQLLPKKSPKPIIIENGINILQKTENSLENGTVLFEKTFGNVRVGFYNIYSGSKNSATPDIRQPFQKEIIKAYSPDAIGFQEFSGKYHDDFTPMMAELGYTAISTSRGKSNCTPIFYKSDKLELLESGHYLYKDTGDYSKSISWAVFRDKSTDNSFAFFNTHFMFRREGVDANDVRKSNATEAIGEFQKVQNKYPDIPMILGGDFNCRVSSDPHKILIDSGLTSAWEKAETKNDSKGHHMYSTFDTEFNVFSQWPSITAKYSSAIDHAYVNNSAKVKAFSTVISYYTLWCSDHMPLFVEIELIN